MLKLWEMRQRAHRSVQHSYSITLKFVTKLLILWIKCIDEQLNRTAIDNIKTICNLMVNLSRSNI